MAKNVSSQFRRCRKLTHAISLRLCFPRVERLLQGQPAFLKFPYGFPVHSKSKFPEIVNAVFPHPINTFRCLITQITAVEVSAQK